MPASSARPKVWVDLTARTFTERLLALQDDEELRKIQRYFKSAEGEYGHGDKFIGVRMGSIFALAKEFAELPLAEIEKLLDSDVHESRVGALSIMAKQYPLKSTTDAQSREIILDTSHLDIGSIKVDGQPSQWEWLPAVAPYGASHSSRAA